MQYEHRNIFMRFLARRHFWRHATFSEVGELYISRMLRMVAINVSASFISVFLYKDGYGLKVIFLYWTSFYLMKVFLALPLASYAAKYGPKHGILLSNILYIPAMLLMSLVPSYGFKALIVSGLLQLMSSTLYNMCYYIDFSKVKQAEHAGKEIAYMNIFEKVATGLSPLLGGALALMWGPAAMMWVAAVFFLLAALPLFRTGEPVKVGEKLEFAGFPWRLAWRSLVANTGVGFDAISSGIVWTLLISVVILAGSTGNSIYAVIGGLASLIVLADIVSSYVYGVIIDRKRGGVLLKFGLAIDILTHASRPFATNVAMAGSLNITNEVGTTAYMMAFTRGMFDVADRTGVRATYIGFVEMMQDLGAALATLVAFTAVSLLGPVSGIRGYFFAAGVFMLVILLARFPLYAKR